MNSAKIRKVIPSKREGASVLAICAFVVYSWSLLQFLWKVPSWKMFLGLWDIASILAYVLSFALLESVTVAFLLACLLSLLRVVFPVFLRDKFIPISSMLVLINAFWAYVLHWSLLSGYVLSWSLGRYLLSILLYILSIGVSVILLHRLDSVAKSLRLFTERLVVFLYLYVPISILGGLVVLARNIG